MNVNIVAERFRCLPRDLYRLLTLCSNGYENKIRPFYSPFCTFSIVRVFFFSERIFNPHAPVTSVELSYVVIPVYICSLLK